MKIKLLVLSVLAFYRTSGQILPSDTSKAAFGIIFTGKVLDSKSHYQASENRIFTYSRVKIFRILKSDAGIILPDTVSIKTDGGVYGNLSQTSSHQIHLTNNSTGTFYTSKHCFYDGTFSRLDLTKEDPSCFVSDTEKKESELNIHEESSYHTLLRKDKLEFSPSAVSAGTNAVITIKGRGFGNTQGKGAVYFRSADNGGTGYIQFSDPVDYISWSDSEIKVRVPSTILSDPARQTSGSGTILILTNAGTTLSSNESLSITYAIRNDAFPLNGRVKGIPHLVSVNPYGKVELVLSNELNSNPDIVTAVSKAIKEWRCLTGVNFVLRKNITENIEDVPVKAGYDNVCSITLTSAFPSSVLARTTHYNTQCINSASNAEIIITKEFDIEINKNAAWDFSSNNLPVVSGKMDFYAVLLHELGHAAGLEHVNSPEDLMYYQVQPSPRKNLMSAPKGKKSAALQASEYLLNTNYKVFPLCNGVTALSKGNCEESPVMLADAEFEVFPNPGSDIIRIYYQGIMSETNTVSITDAGGNEVFNRKTTSFFNGTNTEEINIKFLRPGIYILSVLAGNKKYFRKIAKI